jgi:DNA-binding response OmpR family regulator
MKEQGPRILCIEDDKDTCELLAVALGQTGYELLSVGTAAEGLELAKTRAFDLYLIDNWLPDGLGIDLCKRIRTFDEMTPIVFYSAAASNSDRNAAMDAGAQAYITKPTDIDELQQVIEGFLKPSTRVH